MPSNNQSYGHLGKDARAMDGMAGMMAGMGLLGWLLILAVALVVAAAIKYLFFDRNRNK